MKAASAFVPLVAFSLRNNKLPLAGAVLCPLYLFFFFSRNPHMHLEAAPWPLLCLVALSSGFLLEPSSLGADASPLEFLFTRAIDRRTLFRVMMTVYLALTLCPLVIALGTAAAFRPNLVAALSDETKVAHYLSVFPGSSVMERWPDVVHIALPRGRTMAAAVACWDWAFYTVLYQGLLFWSLPGRRARRIADLISPFVTIGVIASAWWSGLQEAVTLFFASHPVQFASSFVTFILVIAVAYAPYERRFQRLELW